MCVYKCKQTSAYMDVYAYACNNIVTCDYVSICVCIHACLYICNMYAYTSVRVYKRMYVSDVTMHVCMQVLMYIPTMSCLCMTYCSVGYIYSCMYTHICISTCLRMFNKKDGAWAFHDHVYGHESGCFVAKLFPSPVETSHELR